MTPLRDRVAVITGAPSGLGRALAIEPSAAGCAVVLAARGEDALDDTARRCEEVGGRARTVPTDVSGVWK